MSLVVINDEKLTEIYDYGGIYYKVTESEEVHNKLQTDVDFAANYFGSKQFIESVTDIENTVSSIASPSDEDISSNGLINLSEVQFKWDHGMVQLLLKEYLKLKDVFYNRNVRKSTLWGKIRETFLECGHDISIGLISTKFRNLKKTFLKIYFNHAAGKKGYDKITWEYYNTLFEIFKDDRSLNVTGYDRLSHLAAEESGISFRRIAPRPQNPSDVILEMAPTLASSVPSSQTNVNNVPFNIRKAAKRRALLKRKQMLKREKLEAEQLRVQEIQRLIKVMRENNNIQRERNFLLIELFNKCKCNEAVKLFI